MKELSELQDWYAAHCDGEWEHRCGVRIETLDNPGWQITIDLTGTELEGFALPRTRREDGDHDWLEYEVTNGKFVAAGDALKLTVLLTVFEQFVTANAPRL